MYYRIDIGTQNVNRNELSAKVQWLSVIVDGSCYILGRLQNAGMFNVKFRWKMQYMVNGYTREIV